MSSGDCAPLGRRRARLYENRAVGAYTLLGCVDAAGPPPRPGQFYMLATADRWGAGEGADGAGIGRPFLPRAFSYMRARDERLEFLLEAVGPGTARLALAEPGEDLWLCGPLGSGFSAAADARRPLLVGGGIGIVPLACWQDELGSDAPALLGFRDAARAEAASLLADARVATDDGSVGHHGTVTELLAAELDEGPEAFVYACGPPAMLEAVRLICGERGVPAQLALESGMACGYGACFGCVVPTVDGYVRLCIDGPVLDAGCVTTALVAGAGH